MTFNTSGEDCMSRLIDATGTCTNLDKIDSEYDIEETVRWLTERNVTKVCLQFPDDLLNDSVAICKRLRNLTDCKVYIMADSTYDSCCVDEVSAKHVDAEAIIHYGQSCLSASLFPVFYVFHKRQLNIHQTVQTLKSATNDLGQDTVIIYDIAYQHLADELCSKIHQVLPQAIVGKIHIDRENNTDSICGRSLFNSADEKLGLQVLEGSVIIYIGVQGPTVFNLTVSGKALSVSLLDPNIQTVVVQSESIWLKRRRYLIERIKDAGKIGIVVATPSGITARDSIRKARDIVKTAGKRGYVLSVGRPNPAKLANVPEIDIYVLIACPHSTLYSSREFLAPIVHLTELESALNFNIGSEHTDVSLVTGQLRQLPEKQLCNVSSESVSNEITVRDRQDVAELMELGENRSWHGLRVDEGLTDVKMAEEGRRGIAGGYKSEPKQ